MATKPLHQRLGIRRWRYEPQGDKGPYRGIVTEWQGHNRGEVLAFVARGVLGDFTGPIMAAGPDLVRLLKRVLRRTGCTKSCLCPGLDVTACPDWEVHKDIRAIIKKLKV